MKRFYFVTMLLCAAVAVTLSTSCGSDSDDNNSSSLASVLTQYAWKSDVYYDYLEWGDNASLSRDYVTLFFLDGGAGIGKYDSRELDTYFGRSQSSKPYAFSYTLNGSSVVIDGKTYRYKNDRLVAPDGTTFSKMYIYSSDKAWLESAKYYVMEDRDRYNFEFVHSCEQLGEASNVGGGTYLYPCLVSVGVKESAHVCSRQITVIEATYTISGGSFSSSNPKINLIISADEDCQTSQLITVYTKATATVTASFRAWDHKNNKYIDAGTAKYTVGEEHGGNGGQTDGGGNGGSAETKTYTANGVSFKMIGVQGGTFQMGSTTGSIDEKPVHSVTLSSFSIGETEVTQALWRAVMGSNPSRFVGDNRPVEQVSWNDCQTFIQKLNQLTGERFRLPTEAEWEFAAKGGRQSNGYTYSGSNSLDNVAWYGEGWTTGSTHPVATKSPNELGIYDMSGNVFEWCQDWYDGYSSNAQTNPSGPTSGSYRVNRGGGWADNATYCRTAYRGISTPTNTYCDLGLRLAR